MMLLVMHYHICYFIRISNHFIKHATDLFISSLDFDFQMITSQVSRQGHTAIALQFFETVVRYDRFFTAEPQHIPEVLVRMLFSSFDVFECSHLWLGIFEDRKEN